MWVDTGRFYSFSHCSSAVLSIATSSANVVSYFCQEGYSLKTVCRCCQKPSRGLRSQSALVTFNRLLHWPASVSACVMSKTLVYTAAYQTAPPYLKSISRANQTYIKMLGLDTHSDGRESIGEFCAYDALWKSLNLNYLKSRSKPTAVHRQYPSSLSRAAQMTRGTVVTLSLWW